ncbi:hypothetical protein [Sphingobium fuliginis]|nr:hypothetical protein [Sphingobium fuliginis]
MKPFRRNFFGQPIPHAVEMVIVGRYAEIAPHDFSESPITDQHEHALIFHVSLEQAATLNLPSVMDTSEPSGQGRGFDRLAHIAGKLADAKLGLARRDATWRGLDGWQDRQCAIFALFSPDAPVADQIAAQTPPGVDLTGVPVLAVPVWQFTAKERAAIADMLPFIP